MPNLIARSRQLSKTRPAPSGEPQALKTGTKRLIRTTASGGYLQEVVAYLDGGGASEGEAQLKALAYSTSGELLGASEAVTVEAGADARWVNFRFPSRLSVADGEVILALLAGGDDQVARVWGEGFAEPVVNLCPTPNFSHGVGGWVGGAPYGYGLYTLSVRPVPAVSGGLMSVTIEDGDGEPGGLYEGLATEIGTEPRGFGSAKALKPSLPVTPGCAYTAVIDVGVKAQIVESNVAQIWARITWFTADGTYVGNQDGQRHDLESAALVTARICESCVAPAGAERCTFGVYLHRAGAGTIVKTYRALLAVSTTALTEEEALALPYVDGDQPGCSWDGVPGESSSRGPQGDVNLCPTPTFAHGAGKWVAHVATNEEGASATLHEDGEMDITILPKGTLHQVGYRLERGVVPVDGTSLTMRAQYSGTHTGDQNVQPAEVSLWAGHAPESRDSKKTVPVQGNGTIEATLTFGAGASWVRCDAQVWDADAPPDEEQTVIANITDIQINEGEDLPEVTVCGDDVGSDWVGAVAESPSIRWQIPEVGDNFNTPSSSTGLTPAGAHLPDTMALALR